MILPLRERFSEELKSSIKQKEPKKTLIIRLIIAVLKEHDIDASSKGNMQGIADSEITAMLQKMIKQRRDSIALYQQGNRQDLADQEQEEINIISTYLPKQLSDQELQQVLQQLVKTLNVTNAKDFGKVMASLKTQYIGRVDMGKAGALLKQLF
ncbi:MAG: GatB/YqeY domain-containing protein [Rhodospirillaceae bacterium]|nr:GatB/YqeY domain-containing protein [Rhodospirillaceae bacterium]